MGVGRREGADVRWFNKPLSPITPVPITHQLLIRKIACLCPHWREKAHLIGVRKRAKGERTCAKIRQLIINCFP